MSQFISSFRIMPRTSCTEELPEAQAVNTGIHAQDFNETSTQLMSLHLLFYLGLSHLLETLTLNFSPSFKVLTKISHLHNCPASLLKRQNLSFLKRRVCLLIS